MKFLIYLLITNLIFSFERIRADSPRLNPEIFGVTKPAFLIRISNKMPLKRVHREDDELTKYGPEKELRSIFPSTKKNETLGIFYLINKKRQKYESGEYLLRYQWIIMADKTPINKGKYEEINLNCRTNEYYKSGVKDQLRGTYFVLPGKS